MKFMEYGTPPFGTVIVGIANERLMVIGAHALEDRFIAVVIAPESPARTPASIWVPGTVVYPRRNWSYGTIDPP